MTTVHAITGLLVGFAILTKKYLLYEDGTQIRSTFCGENQLLRRLLMDHQARIGEVEELPPSILFPAAPELPR